MTTNTNKWRSKLGNDYDKAMIEQNDAKFKAEIDRLRRLPDNRLCADCGNGPTVWASVNLGVFLCMTCGSHHRGIGTHISQPKGCTGTYLWGPDELERMRTVGNARAKQLYAGDEEEERPPSPTASDAVWRNYLTHKYDPQKQCRSTTLAAVWSSSSFVSLSHTTAAEGGTAETQPDLITFDDKPMGLDVDSKEPPDSLELDFFAEFGV